MQTDRGFNVFTALQQQLPFDQLCYTLAAYDDVHYRGFFLPH